jgi:hypothetical protein
MLDPAVSVVVDSGDTEHPALRVVGGLHDAITLIIHGLRRKPGRAIDERSINGQAGLLVNSGSRPVASVTVDFAGPLVSLVWIRLQPDIG